MPLINPGQYDFSYNQEYLLTKFWNLDIYKTIFLLFWLSIFLIIITYVLIKILRSTFLKEYEKQLQKNRELKLQQEQQEKDIIFIQFHEICRLIYEDLHIFKRPQKMVHQMYASELKDLIKKISFMESYMRKNHRHLIPDYEYYYDKLLKDEFSGGK